MNKLCSLLVILLLTIPAVGAKAQMANRASSVAQLFVDVSAADYIEVVDLRTRRVVDKIVVGQRPHGLAHARHRIAGRMYDFLYVTVEETGELVVVDAQRHDILGRAPVGKEPNQLALTRDGRFAYVPLRGDAQVAVVELDFRVRLRRDGPGESSTAPRILALPRVLKRVPIGEWPHNTYTGPTTGRVYVTSFRGKKIHVFDPSRHEQLFEMEFPGEVRPVALTRDETRAYVAQSDFHGFVVADVNERRILTRVELPPLPPGTPEPFLKTYVHGLTLSPDERELWVTSCAGASVYVYSLPDLKLQAKIPTGKFPHWFAWQAPANREPGGNTSGWLLWVSQMESNQVSALDPVTRTVVATIPTGPMPRRIVVVQER